MPNNHMTRSSKPSDEETIVVSIINFRTPELTIQCAQSVLADMKWTDGKIVIVDNFSDDGSVKILSDWIKSLNPSAPVNLIESVANSGFSAGHNQAMRSCRAKYYLILNSDALIRPGFFEAMFSAVDREQKVGFLAPRLEFLEGGQQTSCFRFHSPLSELIRGASSSPITHILSGYDVPLTNPPQPHQIDWASFACIMLSGNMVKDIGLMDEGYFLYFEDAAYCWNGRKAGWPIIYVPEARVVHFRGGSGPVKKKQYEHRRLPSYYYASRTRYFRQTYGWSGPFMANLCWTLGRIIAHLRWLLGKPVPKACQAEAFDIWTNILTPLKNERSKDPKR